jgi:F0F1-type ATP synthase delta subunit
LLNELSIAGQYDLTSESGRAGLSRALATMQAAAPRLHISFASEPTADFTTKIVTWLRANIHPQLLVQIGLQPGIAVGCTLRTTNKYFDLSLRQTLLKRQDLLQKALAEAR